MRPVRRSSTALLSALMLVLTLVAMPQAPALSQQAELTVERIYASPEFYPEFFGPARWHGDGSGYTTLERSRTVRGGVDIVRYDSASGAREVLVPAERLVPGGSNAPVAVEDYFWSRDGSKLLVFTNGERVWRYNTRGDYWVLDLASGVLRQLGGEAAPSTLMFAKFDPAATRVAYVREHDIYVENIASGAIIRLTHDGSEKIVNGTSDWVYEEEFGLRDGFRWSPDGERIAFWHFDVNGVRDFYMVDNTSDIYSEIIPVQYPKAGTTNSAVTVGVVAASGGPITWFQVPGDPRNDYIPRMEWSGNSGEVVIQRMNRLQNTNRLLLGSAAEGSVRTLLVEEDQAWLDTVDDLRWLRGGELFTWVSERDGWRHIYLGDRADGTLTLLTPGDYDVIEILRIDEEGGWIYFIASPDNPAQRYLYRVPLSGPGATRRLTPADEPGTHEYEISRNGRWAIHTWSRFGVPPTTDLVRLPEHEVVRAMAENRSLMTRVDALRKGDFRFFRVDIGDGVVLDGWEMRPPDFDPSQKYPVLFYVYTEPAGQTVLDSWGSLTWLWHLMLTQKGYVVVSVDNRGTPAPRGREWRKSIYGRVGILNPEDQAAAARRIVAWPYIDEERVGIWGWSGGGSATLNAMFRYPDLYHVGMSVAPVSDQRYYDTIYQERYQGLPQENTEGYRLGSPVTWAHQLEGDLLLVHGTGDDNVHYQNAEAVINALVAANKQFTMMAYPMRSHGIYEGQNTTLHLRTLLTDYLLEHLPPGPRN